MWQNISCNTSKWATFISLNHFMGEFSYFRWYLLPGEGGWHWLGWENTSTNLKIHPSLLFEVWLWRKLSCWKLGTFTCQFEKYGLLCVNLVKLWTFRCEFLIIWTSCWKIWTSCWKIVDFYALILQNIDLICEKCGLLRANFNLVFENCGLFIRVSLKILDFYA